MPAAFAAGPVTYYCGFDPTAPSLHIGNLLQLLTMRRLQDAGHRPLALVGGATGLIGDPRMSGERVLNDRETVAGWVDRIRAQVERYLVFDGPLRAQVVNNLDWTAPLSAIDFLRDIGKHFRVNRMLAKEAVSARLDTRGRHQLHRVQLPDPAGYGLPGALPPARLQAADRRQRPVGQPDRRHRPDPSRGGRGPPAGHAAGDQGGRDEVRQDRERHGLAGRRLTSPYAFYQFWLNAEDAKVGAYLRVFTFRHRDEIDELERATPSGPRGEGAARAWPRM